MINLKESRKLLICMILVWPGASYSHDDAIYVSINPMSCVPAGQTIVEQKYGISAGRVKFKKGMIGTISFICPIGPIHSPDNNESRNSAKADALSISMNYYNETSSSTISAAVRSANLVNGHVQTIIAVNSSSLPSTGASGPNNFFRKSNSGGKLDFTKHTYWVQFNLKRPFIEFSTPDDTLPDPPPPSEGEVALLNIGLKIALLKH